MREPARLSARSAPVVGVAAGLVFVALAVAALLVGVLPGDVPLRAALLELASPTVVAAMRVVNLWGDKLLLGPATLAVLALVPAARRRWWVWPALMVVAPLVEGTVKELIGRPRPEGLGPGFPSGHATAAAAFFGAVCYLAGTLRPVAARAAVRAGAIAMIGLVAAARVILRAHWPSDALGGIALGLALASAAAWVAAVSPRPRESAPPGSAPAPPGRAPGPA